MIKVTELTNDPDTPVYNEVKASHFIKQALTLLPRKGFPNLLFFNFNFTALLFITVHLEKENYEKKEPNHFTAEIMYSPWFAHLMSSETIFTSIFYWKQRGMFNRADLHSPLKVFFFLAASGWDNHQSWVWWNCLRVKSSQAAEERKMSWEGGWESLCNMTSQVEPSSKVSPGGYARGVCVCVCVFVYIISALTLYAIEDHRSAGEGVDYSVRRGVCSFISCHSRCW